MTDEHPTPGPETPPGDLGLETFLEVMRAVRQVQTDTPDWSFDDDQVAAIRHETGPLHLTAGPGSGKSTVTNVTVLKWLLVDGVPPGGIVLTTFTEKAAENLQQRLERDLGALGYADILSIDELHVGTGHQLWGEIMRDYRFDDYRNVDLLDEDAQEMFVARHCKYVDVLADGDAATFRDIVPRLNDDGTCSRGAAATTATRLFNRLSQLRVNTEQLADSERPEFQRLAEGHQEYLETLCAESRCDFARLQERFLGFLETDGGKRFAQGDIQRSEPALQRIAVDEYQDVNPLQQAIYFRLAELMPEEVPTLVVVGDDDQALYRFRGGTVDCLIEFPDRLSDYLGINRNEIDTEQLRWNYRSRPEIVDWVNRHIGYHPVMQAEDARAPGKEPMNAARDAVDHPSVHLLKEDNKAEAAAAFADQVQQLHADGYVQDLNQVALLAHSTREYWPQWENTTFVGECVNALEARNIPVHNPRNKGFLQHEEIQAMLAALAACFDPGLEWAEDNVFPYGVLGADFQEWTATLDDVIDQYGASALADYLEITATRIRSASSGTVANVSTVDLYNRIRSFEPFSTWTKDDNHVNRAKRLGKLSQLLESFEGIAEGVTENRKLTRTSHDQYDTVSVRFLSDYYWTFCQYLQTAGLDDPENQYDIFPSGHVQVMTVHQAKGLEFAVVFLASLELTPEKTYDETEEGDPVPRVADLLSDYTDRTPPTDVPTRAERDLVRQFYVAHSRAEENLVLLGTDWYLEDADGRTVLPSLGTDATSPVGVGWFDADQRVDQGATLNSGGRTVGPPAADNVRRTYSIVADVLSFRRCKRQYGYHTEHEFAAGSGTQLFAGLAVHQTLDWAHRYYNGNVDGVPGGTAPDERALRTEFESVVESLRDQRVMPMGRDAVDAVFKHVKRFNVQTGPELYPQIIDTECKLRRNAGEFILTGVTDVIAGDAGQNKLCDYKASQRPKPGEGYLDDYREQLLVYAGLYEEKDGEYPDSAVLYFLGEEDQSGTRLELDFTEAEVRAAMARFEETVKELESVRRLNDWDELDEDDLPDEATCAECDFRWDCDARDYDDR
ncbi:ATP-dependent DNA helicase [Natronobiforma cellulositropha]|uniref:ATP-dependent DNA helicase n=1 Tax=Natronobiforma cellulositropha TaxID=1679076 RepID=UPI0021D5CC56|nr:ATP-dependent DNA helicase [Natronobiforma cellulositropha]